MKKYLSIGTIAKEVGCSTSLIRIYELRGIVTAIRDSQERRLFTEFDIEKIKRYRESIHAN